MNLLRLPLLLLSIALLNFPIAAIAQTICVYNGTQQIYMTAPRDNSIVTGLVNVSGFTNAGVSPADCVYSQKIIVTVSGGPFQQTLKYEGNYKSFDSSTLAPGDYRVTMQYLVNSRSVYDYADVTIYRDESGPDIFLPGVVDNSELSGSGTIQIDSYDESGIQDVQILLGVTEVGYVNNQGKKNLDTSIVIDSTDVPDGDYELIARATDTLGHVSEYKINVRVNNVDDKPEITILSPAAGSEVAGKVRIRTNTTDDNGIKSLSCYISGVLVSSTTSSPYDCVIDTPAYDDGPYQIGLIAKDTANNTDTKFIYLNFKNSPNDAPTISILSPAQGQVLKGTSKVVVDAQDDLAVKKVDYFLGELFVGTSNLSPFTLNLNSANVADGIYQLKAVAYDYSDLTDSDYVIVTIRNGDNEKPSVFITNPAELSILSGTVTVESLAVDNVSVKEVRYYLDNELLTIKKVAPYSFKLETALYADGDHTLTAIAVDYTNNQGSHTIQITIDSFSPPTEIPDEGPNAGDGGTDTGNGQESLDDTVATLADNLNDLISTVNTLSENQTELQEQVAAMQAMLNELLEIFASASSEESAAMKANPRKGKRLTSKANRMVSKMFKAKRPRAFKKRKRAARKAIRKLKRFLG